MNLIGARVIANTERHHDVEGIVMGVTVDDWYIIDAGGISKFWARRSEFKIISL